MQCVSEICVVHVLQDVQCDLQRSVSDTVQILLILHLPLSACWVIWTQELPKPLQLILYQSDDFVFQLLVRNTQEQI